MSENKEQNNRIISTEYSELLSKSFLNYSVSILTGRAVPSVTDGCKPIARKIVYAMDEQGFNSNKPTHKSVKSVSAVLGAYSPHSDVATYDALVGLSHDFKKPHPLVEVQGSAGSVTDKTAAAMRYTEARLTKFAEDVLLRDIDKETVDFMPNFDNTTVEPVTLPAKIPFVLLSNPEGIGVGMISSIPTHNLCELVDTEVALIKNPELTVEELMEIFKGPDFSTGGFCDSKGLLEVYSTGAGRIKLRGKVEVEDMKGGKKRLVVTEIPYSMIWATDKFLTEVCELAENRVLPEVVDVADHTNRHGIRLVIELKKDADVNRVMSILYKKTQLECTFPVNMLCIADNKPQVLNLKEILEHHIKFRFQCEDRKYRYMLRKEEDKQEIQEGLIKACDVIDTIIEVLRGSSEVKVAKECLMTGKTDGIKFKTKTAQKKAEQFSFTDRQAQAILDMRLQKLIGLEIKELMAENKKTLQNINTYNKILSDKGEMSRIIIEDMERIKKEYGFPRRTEIVSMEDVVVEEKKAPAQPVVILMDKFGYIRTVEASVYERNKEAADSENKYVIPCMSDTKLCIFTVGGMMHQIKVESIPLKKFRDKGIPVDNISNYNSSNERILSIMTESDFTDGKKLLFTTKLGMMKQVDVSEFIVSKKLVAATKFNDGDELTSIQVVEPDDMIVLKTKGGFFLKFASKEVPEKKKGAVGVRGIKLQAKDHIENVYLYTDGVETKVMIKDKEVTLNRLKTAKRDGTGIKQR